MKAIIAAAIVFCVALIGGGYYLATKADNGPRQVPLNQAYTDRVAAGGWVTGPATAKVKLIEYGDFQCPACGFMHPIVKQSIADTKDVLQFTFRNYPLPMHDKANLSATGAEAAGRQGKYWEMYDLLYGSQDEWSKDSLSAFRTQLETYATKIGLDSTQFKRDLEDQAIQDLIQKDTDNGDKVPVKGTPTLILNGKVIDQLPKTSAELTKLIRDAANASN